jgi:predicted aspartyl protease
MEIANLTTGDWTEFQALVDTSAHFTQVPASVLREMGYEPDAMSPFLGADGSHVDLPIGDVRLRIGDEARTVVVIFAEEDAPVLLGATALENFRLMPDPIWHILRPIVAMRTTRLADTAWDAIPMPSLHPAEDDNI